MKKSTFTLFVFVAVLLYTTIDLQGQISSQQPQGQIPTETFINLTKGPMNVLVIRDVLPWGDDVTVPILTGMGATVSTATSVTFPGLDFSVYSKIVVESSQPEAFYTVFEANLAKFEAFVNAGGILQINGCTQGYSFQLPGGASCVSSWSDDGYHALPGHPFLVGVPDPFFGDWANHNIISNLLPGTEIVTRDIPGNNPTTVIYHIGSGTVIASGLTLEIAYFFELNGTLGYFNFGLNMYPNMLEYNVQEPGVVPISTWALFLGMALIGSMAVLRYRRIL